MNYGCWLRITTAHPPPANGRFQLCVLVVADLSFSPEPESNSGNHRTCKKPSDEKPYLAPNGASNQCTGMPAPVERCLEGGHARPLLLRKPGWRLTGHSQEDAASDSRQLTI